MGAQYAIMRFAKYKGGAMGGIEAHNERKKEKYASNPDVDTNRSDQNFHFIESQLSYRQESDRQIKAAKCRVRSDSVRMVEALFTASPEFFEGKSREEVQGFFREALDFFCQNQRKDTIISAVVHMDEKTPHMHLTFVPLTEDNRLCAKEIIGNKKKLTEWQDKYWKHMVAKYPDLERGESASKTGRTHIPPRIFKEFVNLQAQRTELDELLQGVGAFNAKRRAERIEALVGEYIPAVEKMLTQLKKYEEGFQELTRENSTLRQENNDIRSESAHYRIDAAKSMADVARMQKTLAAIPVELLEMYYKSLDQDKEHQR